MERLPMRKIREILRLRHEKGLSQPSVPTWLRHLTPRLIRVQGGEMRPLGSRPQ
jgi:hypothetical protein